MTGALLAVAGVLALAAVVAWWRSARLMRRPGRATSDVPAATRWLVEQASEEEQANIWLLEFIGLEDGMPPRTAQEGALLTGFYAVRGKGEMRSSARRLLSLATQRFANDPDLRERFEADVLQKMRASAGR